MFDEELRAVILEVITEMCVGQSLLGGLGLFVFSVGIHGVIFPSTVSAVLIPLTSLKHYFLCSR